MDGRPGPSIRVKIELMRKLTFSVSCLLLAIGGEAQLVRDWRSVRTAHFELVSRYDPAVTSPLLLDLEWARAVFETNYGSQSRLDRQALLLIPDSPFDYEQVSPSKFSDGFYLGAPWRDFILLRALLKARQGLFHEYTHLILHHEGGQWPVWFNEGTAEYYSTMQRSGGSVEVGLPDPARLASLRKSVWLPISYLTTLNGTSSLTSVQAVQAFYAQSWLFVHMLHLSPAYGAGLASFRALLADGLPSDEALRRVYGKSLVQFDEDGRAWLRQGRFPVERLKAPPEPAASVESTVIGTADVEIARLTVMASGPGRSEAESGYLRLAKTTGGRCELQPALGDLAFAARLFRQASGHYRESLGCGASAAGLAQGLEMALSFRQDLRRDELEEVAALTGSGRSHFLFGVGLFFDKDYQGAVRELEMAGGLAQADEFRKNRIRAISLAKLRRFGEAHEAAQGLKSLATDVHQRQSALLTIEDVERERQMAEAPPEPMHKIDSQGHDPA